MEQSSQMKMIRIREKDELFLLDMDELIQLYNTYATESVQGFPDKEAAVDTVWETVSDPVDLMVFEVDITSDPGRTLDRETLKATEIIYEAIQEAVSRIQIPRRPEPRPSTVGVHERAIDTCEVRTVDLTSRVPDARPIEREKPNKQYHWKHRGLTDFVRGLFPEVGMSYPIEELRRLAAEAGYPWNKTTVKMSKLRGERQGMDIQRNKKEGTYERIQ